MMSGIGGRSLGSRGSRSRRNRPQDHLLPMVGITRELSIQFAFGYTPEEFAETHRAIAAGHGT